MHLAGRFAQQLYPSLQGRSSPTRRRRRSSRSCCGWPGLLHDVGPRALRPLLRRQLPRRLRPHPRAGRASASSARSWPTCCAGCAGARTGAFDADERIDPEWICYLMGKSYTQPAAESIPRWLPFLKPLLSGVYTADNMDYVLRDSYMCGVAVGPIDIERIIYYSFFSEKGLTLDRSGLQAFIMFLNARFYMYTNVYYHRTTRGIDLHLKEIFRDTMRIGLPLRPAQGPPPVSAPDGVDAARGGRRAGTTPTTPERRDARRGVAADPRPPAQVAHVARGGARPLRAARAGQGFLNAEEVEQRVRAFLPARAARLPVQDRHGAAGPAPAEPAQDGRPADLRLRLGAPERCPRSRSPRSSSTCPARSPSAGSSR